MTAGHPATTALLGRFLEAARSRARRVHLALYEDLVAATTSYMADTRRRTFSPADLGPLLASWYHEQPAGARRTRRFCAAGLVLVRWLTRDMPPRRRRRERRGASRAAHHVVRAARATELLDALPTVRATGAPSTDVDDYWEIVARGGSHLILRPLASTVTLAALQVPAALADCLDPGALVNLRLGRHGGRWRVLESGPCYPPAARAAMLRSRIPELRG